MSALRGRRILITRAAHQAPASASLVEARGGVPVCVPCIEVRLHPEAVRQALRAAPAGATVLVTSANAVRALGAADMPRETLERLDFVCVGARTREALARLGIAARAPEGRHDQEAVWALWRREGLPASVVFLRAEEGRDWLVRRLGEAGVPVELVPAYGTRPRAAARPELARAFARGVDAATFASAQTAEAFLSLAGDARAKDWLAAIPVVAISARAAAPLARLGLDVLVAGQPASFERMLERLASFWEGRP